MQPVLTQANVPIENAANLQNDNYHIDHGNVEYRIQNESRSSSPHIADTVDHDNIELDIQNEPMPSSVHQEVPNMPVSPEMEVPNMPASPEMEVPNMPVHPEMQVPNMPASPEMQVPNMASSTDNDDNADFGDNEEDNPNIVPDQYHQPSVPIENYIGDIDNLDDFANHWLWQNRDTGASFTQFTGTPGLLLDPQNTKLVDFFNLLFEDQMYKLTACETNRYAESKMQGKFLIHHKFISVHLNSTVISSMCKPIN